MGGGSWTSASYDAYTKGTRGMDSATYAASNLNTQEVYKARALDKELNPKNVMRECCDTEEHPHTSSVKSLPYLFKNLSCFLFNPWCEPYLRQSFA